MKKPKAPKLVTVAIFTTITIIFWIFFSLYTIFTTSAPVEVNPGLLEPLTPSLDEEALQSLEGRIFYEETDIIVPFTVPESIVTPEQTAPPEPTLTPEVTTEPSTEEAGDVAPESEEPVEVVP